MKHAPLALRRSSLLAIALAAIVATAAAGQTASEDPSTLAITDVTVVPMDAERLVAGQTVLVAGGRIAAIGDASAIHVPPDAQVVEGGGRYLVPGLTDTHVHLGEEEAATHLLLYLAHGVTTVQSLSGSPWHLELRGRVAEGRLPGPRILTTGPTTATARVNSPETARRFVAEQAAAGYDAIKMYGDGNRSMTAETYRAVIAAAHAAGLRVTGHAPRNHPLSLVLEGGQDSIDHAEEIVYTYTPITEVIGPLIDAQFGRAAPETAEPLLDDLPALRSRLAPALDRLAGEAAASGVAIAPTLVAFRTIWKQTTDDYSELLQSPELEWMHPLTRAEWGPLLNGYRQGWQDRMELASRILGFGFEIQMAMIPRLAEAGVPILTGTDAPLEFVFPGWALHRELELLVEAGLTPYRALRASTADAARELGLGATSGRVAPGLSADLVLLDANPLEAIGNVGRIAGVVASGRWLPRAELDRRVAESIAGYEALERVTGPILAGFEAGDAAAIAAAYGEIGSDDRSAARFTERLINAVGYVHLGADDAAAAVAALELNAELFADSANVWDSLGEARMMGGDLEGSLAAYRRALELDPGFENPKTYVAFLEEVVPARADPPSLTPEDLARYAGDYGERHFRVEGERLLYRRGEGEARPLVALGEHRFMIPGTGFFMLRFELGPDGVPARVVGVYAQGHTDESQRDR